MTFKIIHPFHETVSSGRMLVKGFDAWENGRLPEPPTDAGHAAELLHEAGIITLAPQYPCCPDCGARNESKGHMTCQFPG